MPLAAPVITATFPSNFPIIAPMFGRLLRLRRVLSSMRRAEAQRLPSAAAGLRKERRNVGRRNKARAA